MTIAVDGSWGRETTTALQKWLMKSKSGLAADGVLDSQSQILYDRGIMPAADPDSFDFSNPAYGSATVRAFQEVMCEAGALSDDDDGIIGDKTIRGIQTFLQNKGYDVGVDGELGPYTVRALQTFLNDQEAEEVAAAAAEEEAAKAAEEEAAKAAAEANKNIFEKIAGNVAQAVEDVAENIKSGGRQKADEIEEEAKG